MLCSKMMIFISVGCFEDPTPLFLSEEYYLFHLSYPVSDIMKPERFYSVFGNVLNAMKQKKIDIGA